MLQFCSHVCIEWSFFVYSRKLVYSDLEAVAPLEVEKMPYALQSITISVRYTQYNTSGSLSCLIGDIESRSMEMHHQMC